MIIDEDLKSENYEPIAYEDFDAVMYTTTNIETLYNQFTIICSPFTHNAFQFKPTFFSTQITERPLISSSDGLADDINSQVVIDEIIRIQKRMFELGFKIFFTDHNFWTIDRHFYAFCRHCLSRSNRLPEMEIVKGSPFGYLHPLLYVMLKGLKLPASDFLGARTKIINEFDYLDNKELVAIVHVCPKCFDKGMLYLETCPKCGSVDIAEHSMLHHFRCANISPESTYMKDGELVCPKCMRELHHIGVDYDRPTTSYNCNKCSINFSHAKVICECESCLTKSDIVPLYNVEINAKGIKMLAITNDFLYSADTRRFNNVLTFNQFKNVLQVRLSIVSNMDNEHILRVYSANVTNPDLFDKHGADLISTAYSLIPHANISIHNNTIYIITERASRISEDDLAKIKDKMFSGVGGMLLGFKYIEYERGMDIDEFIAQI